MFTSLTYIINTFALCMSTQNAVYMYIPDFGIEHLVRIAEETNFPWLMSNVRDRHTGQLLADGRESLILNWEGRKVCVCVCVRA